jgi:signal transduction histidine kinase
MQPDDTLDTSRLILLYNAAKALSSTTDTDQLLLTIVNEVRNVLDCEGAGVLLYDEEKQDFYWRKIQDKERILSSASLNIRIPKDKGVCGWVFASGQPALVNQALSDSRVYRHVDDVSGFTTKTMICVPLQGRDKRIGVLYALNKIDGLFTESDVSVMVALSGSVALALENATVFENLLTSHEELDRLNRVKSKVLNHLSHELKTPIAVIEATLSLIEFRLEHGGIDVASLPFLRISRNLDRLKIIERQVGYILEGDEFQERSVLLSFLDHFGDFIDISGDETPHLRQALQTLRKKVEEVFPARFEEDELVKVDEIFQAVEENLREIQLKRNLQIQFIDGNSISLKIQPHILLSILVGLTKNAVENTPDHGKIIVAGQLSSDAFKISVTDYGVGIPESESRNIFEGFYPLRETDLYSSGSSYGFNAGGTGTDLLKIKIYAERFGFKISCRSQRCDVVPTVRDICPGDISKCKPCKCDDDCYKNGGTEFLLQFPPELIVA